MSGLAFRKATACTACTCRNNSTIRRATLNIRRSRNISGTRFTSGKAGLATKRDFCPLPAICSPNTSWHGRQPRALCVWHPHGTTETEAWRFFLVDADAPAYVKDVLRHFYMRYSGPAGMTEQDDMENWLYATQASKGTIARRYPFNYQMSMGAYKVDDPMPGMVSTQITDQTPRNYYRVYARYMKGEFVGPVARPRPGAVTGRGGMKRGLGMVRTEAGGRGVPVSGSRSAGRAEISRMARSVGGGSGLLHADPP